MRIKPIAADSLGVRSMATLVKTRDTSILIDPSAALGPRRFGLRPHKVELKALEESWNNIVEYAEDVDVIIITHYHYDHHSRKRNIEIYKGKILFIKDPQSMINDSQRWRSRAFLKRIEGLPERIIIADGKEFFIGDTLISFSDPVPHGEQNTKLGYVLEVFIERGTHSFLFSSDVEGLLDNSQVRFIVEHNPEVVYLDGPPVYLGERKLPWELLETSINNIRYVIENTDVRKLIIDHHLLRDLRFREYMGGINSFITVADFIGVPLNMLEARRRELWGVKSE